jgi:amidase
VKLCQELGHELVEAAPKFDAEAMTQAYFTLYGAYTASSLAHFSRLAKRKLEPGLVEPHTWALAEIGRSTSSGDYLNAVATLQRTTREIAHFFVNHDLFLTPTLTEPPPLLGSFDAPPEAALLGLFRAGAYASFTSLANITGQPAMSVPLEVSAEGLPIGIQFMGRFGDEAGLFRLAAQLEKARPWAARRPSLASSP